MAGGRATALSLCLQAVGCGLSDLAAQFSDESALEVCNTWYALYKSTFLPFLYRAIDQSNCKRIVFVLRFVLVNENTFVLSNIFFMKTQRATSRQIHIRTVLMLSVFSL